jgi:hypothetical protein
MIFNADPSQIEKLDSKQLVELLKKLLHAEAQKFGIGLRGVSVPLQINVPDGGEDGRISWKGGHEDTGYLPSRFCMFQSKATSADKMAKAGWKKEVWTKASQKKDAIRELNDAVKDAIENNGSYIGFTSAVLIGSTKYKDRIDGIKEGILEAGANPDSLKTIDIYDANNIAAWVEEHPAVAVWLNERQSELSLRGFQTVEKWGKRSDIASIPQVEDKENRFSIGSKNVSSKEILIPFDEAKEQIINYLSEPKKFIRVIGSSGVGKTRFVYEVFRDEDTITKNTLKTSAIYCDFRDVSDRIIPIIESLLDAKNSTLIIVDECPREAAIRIGEIVASEGSNFKVLTIGNDNQPIEKDNCLNISILPADDTLIEGIIKQRHPKANCVDINFIREISCGYPRFAVLVTDSYLSGTPILKAVEGAVERMLIGCGINRVEQVRAIECLALFKELGADEDSSSEIDFVAKNLARQTGDEMYEHLAHAAKQGIVAHQDDYFVMQFPPISAFLGARRLDLLRVKTILDFIENSSPALRRSFLSQWDNFTGSRTASKVAQRLLSEGGWCGSLDGLNTEIGSQCLKAIVHIDPDRVTNVIESIYGRISLDDLKTVVTRRQDLLEVLEKLVPRKESFQVAAPLLMRLAAIENDPVCWPYRNAKNIFKKLFQLFLSGTKAEFSERFTVIDNGIESNDERIILICIDALENTLTNRFSENGNSNSRINQPPLKDWESKHWDEVVDFKRNGIQRIKDIRVKYKKFSSRCEEILLSCTWFLLNNNLLGDVETIIKDISKEKGVWFEAIKEINGWLYSCRTEKSEEYYQKVEKFYDDIIPEDLTQQALLYTKIRLKDIHTLNLDINCQCSEDFEYSFKKAKEVATEIGKCKNTTYNTAQIMVKEKLNIIEFVGELVLYLEDPVEAFKITVKAFEQSTEQKGIQFVRELINGIDRRDNEAANKCVQIASESDPFKNKITEIYSAINISAERFNEIMKGLKNGSISAIGCSFLSRGVKLGCLSIEDICSLIDELVANHGSDGAWEALETIYLIYCQNKEENLDEQIIQRLKDLINSPKLLENAERCNRDEYIDELTPLVQNDSF